MKIMSKNQYEQLLIKRGLSDDIDKTKLSKDEFLIYVKTITNLINQEFKNDKRVIKVNRLISNYEQNKRLPVKFKITDSKVKSLTDPLSYNTPYRAYYSLIKYLKSLLPGYDIIDQLDETLLFRIDKNIKSYDYDLIHHSYYCYRSYKGPVVSCSIFNNDNKEVLLDYVSSYKYLLYDSPGRSLLDLHNYELKFYLLISLFSAMEKNGFVYYR